MTSLRFAEEINFSHERYAIIKDKGFYPDRILDIGANVGQWFRFIKTVYPKSEVLSIEANPHNFESIYSVNPNSKIMLLGKEEGEADFFITDTPANGEIPGFNAGCSVHQENSHGYSENKKITLPVKTLDSLGERFDLIKMDTQGSELDIIKGGLETVASCSFLQIELGVLKHNKGAPLAAEVTSYLNEIGFYFYEILAHFYWGKRLLHYDALFVNKRLENILELD
jgi:FkbM family methyltransferase